MISMATTSPFKRSKYHTKVTAILWSPLPIQKKDPFEVLDPLLDFGLDDDLTINKGSGGRDSTGADLVKSTIEVQRALKVRVYYS